VRLTSEERATLRSWLAAGKTERRMAFRAVVILAVAEGLSNEAAAARLGARPATVSKWRGRFARERLPGLAVRRAAASRPITRLSTSADSGGFGRATTGRLRALGRSPAGHAFGRRLQASEPRVQRHGITTLFAALDAATGLPAPPAGRVPALYEPHRRRTEISLARRRSWCISTDPCFAQKAAHVASGSICSRRRMRWCCRSTKSPTSKPWSAPQGWLKLPNGKVLTGFIPAGKFTSSWTI
jgi:Homeodomain-like domain